MITDQQSLDGATINGSALAIWDDGFGPLWLVCNEYGPIGVVRAQTWEEAWSCAVDEIFYDAGVDESDFDENGECEGVDFRGSGNPSNSHISTMYADTMHGRLDRLTSERAAELEIEIQASDWE